MNPEAERFLQELKKAMTDNPNKNEIIAEYTVHVEDMMGELEVEEGKVYAALVERLGEPAELAAIWKEEQSITPKKMQRLFVFLNIAIFIGGSILTAGYNILEWTWLGRVWGVLTESTTIIIFIYMFFWALLGYEIGKAFGARGKKILLRTFIISVIPNLILMYLIIFQFIPYEWFDPLLEVPFIILSIVSTIALYPISWLGYRWGRRASV